MDHAVVVAQSFDPVHAILLHSRADALRVKLGASLIDVLRVEVTWRHAREQLPAGHVGAAARSSLDRCEAPQQRRVGGFRQLRHHGASCSWLRQAVEVVRPDMADEVFVLRRHGRVAVELAQPMAHGERNLEGFADSADSCRREARAFQELWIIVFIELERCVDELLQDLGFGEWTATPFEVDAFGQLVGHTLAVGVVGRLFADPLEAEAPGRGRCERSVHRGFGFRRDVVA